MTRKLLLFLLFLDLAAFAQTPNPKTVSYLQKFTSAYTKSLFDRTPETLQSYYNDSIRLMPEFQKTIVGKENVAAYHKAFGLRFNITAYSRETSEILDLGSYVTEFGLSSLTINLKTNGAAYKLEGKYMDIWQKKNNGLFLVAQAWNYNHQVEIANLLRFAELPVADVAVMAHLPINTNISFELAALNRLQEMIISQHDFKLWSQFFTDDAKYIYSASPVYNGKKAISDFLVEHAKYLPVFEKLDIRNDRIDNLGTHVIEYASHIAIIRNGDFSGVFTGKNIVIWRREKDGSLKMFREMAMYD